MPSEVYLDNAATTKPYKEVVEAISDALSTDYGNPSSVHGKGKQAKKILEESREIVAASLKVSPNEIYFTSGGTESNNLAIHGVCLARAKQRGNIITSALEHPSVTKSIRNLKRQGWHVDYVNAIGGHLDLDCLRDALNTQTTLISIMSVQNELGYRFPLDKVVDIIDEIAPQILLHTDAVQAFGKFPLSPLETGIDLASISSHKIGGPKGVGALFVKAGTTMYTTAFGGGQERGLRSGTESLPLISGFATAAKITLSKMESTTTHVSKLNEYLRLVLQQNFADVIVNSRTDGSPYILNFTLPGVNNKKALEFLSSKAVFVSTASACESNHSSVPPGTWREKHPLIIEHAGIPKNLSNSTMRIGFSADNTVKDIQRFIDLLTIYVNEHRQS